VVIAAPSEPHEVLISFPKSASMQPVTVDKPQAPSPKSLGESSDGRVLEIRSSRIQLILAPPFTLLEVPGDRLGFEIFISFWKSGNSDAVTDAKILKFDIRIGKFQDGVFRHPNFVLFGFGCRTSATGTSATATSARITSTAAAREPNTSITTAPTAIPSVAPFTATVTLLIRSWLNQLLNLESPLLRINFSDLGRGDQFCSICFLSFVFVLVSV
jgi:hypothetical protein